MGLTKGETKDGVGAGGAVQVAIAEARSMAIGNARVENLRLTLDYPNGILRLE